MTEIALSPRSRSGCRTWRQVLQSDISFEQCISAAFARRASDRATRCVGHLALGRAYL